MRTGLRGGQFGGIFTQDELEALHATTLRVLSEVGLISHSERITEVFEEGGADVDKKERRIRIPESLVKEALKKAPSSFVLCGRNPKNDIHLKKNAVYFGFGGSPCPYVVDLDTSEYRRPTQKDFAEATRLADAMENISYVSALGGAYDVPYEVEYEHEVAILLNNTEKPISYWAPSAYTARKVLDMVEAVVGGPDQLRKRPIIIIGGELCSPLVIPAQVEGILEFAKAGIPTFSAPVPQGGASAPATLAGSFLVGNAETLALLTLVQLVNPGVPFPYMVITRFVDPLGAERAQSAPETATARLILNAQMAAYYGLPSRGLPPITGAKVPDAQAGAVVMRGALLATLMGLNMVGGPGWLNDANAGSMELAVMSDEVIGHISGMFENVKVDEDTLVFNVIKEVGPGGSFLSHKHTLKHIGEIYTARHRNGVFFDATPEATWMKAGKKDARARIREKTKKILKEHQPERLPKHVQKRIEEIVEAADRKKVSS